MTSPIMPTPYPGKNAWPVNWQASRLTGRFVDLLGEPVANKQIVLTPSVSSFTSEATSTIITAVPRTLVTSAAGTLDVFVPATDDPDILPVGWTYKVEEKFGANRVYHIEAHVNEILDLSRVVPSPPSTGEASTRGEPGPAGPPGPQGVGVPTGGAAGTVLAKSGPGDYETVWLQVAEDGTIEGPSAYDIAVSQGFNGPVETWLRSLVGEQGPPGPTGPTGPAGPQGIPGQNGSSGLAGPAGKSAYALAQEQGYTGTQAQWIASLKGVKGDPGNQGPVGPAGPAGPAGPVGPQGPQGIPGDSTSAGILVQDVAGGTYTQTEGKFYFGIDFPETFPDGSIFFRKAGQA